MMRTTVRELLLAIEDAVKVPEFYLANDVDWLYRQIQTLPSVGLLLSLVMDHDDMPDQVVSRVVELMDLPVQADAISEHEAAICCYAYVLSRLPSNYGRWALDYLDARSGPAYGWLSLLMVRYLRNDCTSAFLSDADDEERFIGSCYSLESGPAATPLSRESTYETLDERSLDELLVR